MHSVFEYEKSTNASSVIERLARINMTGSRMKLKVDEDDILGDALAYYKNPAFDARRPLRISFTGQPAIDTGGVCKEFFSAVKEQFVKGDAFSLFEGSEDNLLFSYNQQYLFAGLPKILGTIVAHSLVHQCGGFPHLAPSHYYYVATGDAGKSSAYTCIDDVHSPEKQDILGKVLVIPLYIIHKPFFLIFFST